MNRTNRILLVGLVLLIYVPMFLYLYTGIGIAYPLIVQQILVDMLGVAIYGGIAFLVVRTIRRWVMSGKS